MRDYQGLLEKSAPALLILQTSHSTYSMNPLRVQLINSLVWIISGALVIAIRLWILRSASILIWEALGTIMIAYGTGKVLWILARTSHSKSSIP